MLQTASNIVVACTRNNHYVPEKVRLNVHCSAKNHNIEILIDIYIVYK